MSDRIGDYAATVVGIARTEGALDVVLDELSQVEAALSQHEELRDALADSTRPVASKLAFLESESLRAASGPTRTALATLLAAGLGGELGEVVTEVARRGAEEQGRALAEVRVAVELDEDRLEALRRALEQATGRSLELQVVVDPDVVGGVRAIVGDTILDGSVARRLDDIRTKVGA